MNMAIRGIYFNFGKESSNSFTSDQHPHLRVDEVMVNPRSICANGGTRSSKATRASAMALRSAAMPSLSGSVTFFTASPMRTAWRSSWPMAP